MLCIFSNMKELYVLQPYEVGSRTAKSLALIIPAKVARECGIGISTVFALSTNPSTKRVVLQQIPYPMQDLKPDEAMITAGGRFNNSHEQKSSTIGIASR
jgi:hypothetical protein